jgi:hypothetical protein
MRYSSEGFRFAAKVQPKKGGPAKKRALPGNWRDAAK